MSRLLLVVVLASTFSDAQIVPSAMRAAVVIDEYFGTTYAAPSSESRAYVFFEREPIKLRLQVTNRKEEPAELRLSSSSGSQTFDAMVSDGSNQRAIDVRISDAHLRVATGERLPVTTLNVGLDQLESVEWDAEVNQSLPVGRHKIAFSTNVSDATGKQILWQTDEITIEVRSRVGASVEITRREALREFTSGNPGAARRADAAADRLLRIHPRSYEALLLKGQIAELEGQEVRAREFTSRALNILREGQDDLFLKFRSKAEADDAKNRIEAMLRK